MANIDVGAGWQRWWLEPPSTSIDETVRRAVWRRLDEDMITVTVRNDGDPATSADVGIRGLDGRRFGGVTIAGPMVAHGPPGFRVTRVEIDSKDVTNEVEIIGAEIGHWR